MVELWSFKEAATFGTRSREEFCATRGILRAPFSIGAEIFTYYTKKYFSIVVFDEIWEIPKRYFQKMKPLAFPSGALTLDIKIDDESPPQRISVGGVTSYPLNITIHKKICNMGLA